MVNDLGRKAKLSAMLLAPSSLILLHLNNKLKISKWKINENKKIKIKVKILKVNREIGQWLW